MTEVCRDVTGTPSLPTACSFRSQLGSQGCVRATLHSHRAVLRSVSAAAASKRLVEGDSASIWGGQRRVKLHALSSCSKAAAPKLTVVREYSRRFHQGAQCRRTPAECWPCCHFPSRGNGEEACDACLQVRGLHSTAAQQQQQQQQQDMRTEKGLASQEEQFDEITDKHIPVRPVSVVEATSYTVVIVGGAAPRPCSVRCDPCVPPEQYSEQTSSKSTHTMC